MSRFVVPLIALLAACGGKSDAPAWTEDCSCGDLLCLQDGAPICVTVPEVCEPAFEASCDPGAFGPDCIRELCGPQEGTFEMSCYEDADGEIQRWATCEAIN